MNMNRIVLIGNGFDLAHGLKTSYDDFVSELWKEIYYDIQSKQLKYQFHYNELIQFKGNIRFWDSGFDGNYYNELNRILIRDKIKVTFFNQFLKIINEKKNLQNWVNIENEYYDILLSIINNKQNQYNLPAEYSIDHLNNDFKIIKDHLLNYLIRIKTEFENKNEFDSTFKRNIGSKIYSHFNISDFSGEYLSKRVNEEYERLMPLKQALEKRDIEEPILTFKDEKILNELKKNKFTKENLKNLFLSHNSYEYFNLYPQNILFLSFNYTLTESLYSKPAEFDSKLPLINNKYIHIHGDLKNIDENPIIFGFGDELDENYKIIENVNDNKYLENVKSIKYLETDNYKNLLDFVNSDSYQVFIFGHSCGNSDRTLLNTLFEHDNCASIKVFYYKKEDGTDYFNDVIGNISRNFNSKAKLRDRVVNKKYSEPLS